MDLRFKIFLLHFERNINTQLTHEIDKDPIPGQQHLHHHDIPAQRGLPQWLPLQTVEQAWCMLQVLGNQVCFTPLAQGSKGLQVRG